MNNRDDNRKKQVYCSEEGLVLFLFGVEVVGERDADVVVQCVLPLVGLLVGGLAAPAPVILVEDVIGEEPDVAFVL